MTRALNPHIPILMALAILPLGACQVESGDPIDSTEAVHIDKIFSGYVLDEAGAPLAGVDVVSDDGDLVFTTNAVGQFILMMEFYDGRESLELFFSKDGYMKSNQSIPIVDATSSYTTLLTLYTQSESKVLSNETGGVIDFGEGSLILDFGPNAFTDEYGSQVVGDIEIFARVIQPEDLKPEAMPVPSMMAKDPTNPYDDVMISSYGMFNMEAYSGETQVYPASGSAFEITMTDIDRFVATEEGEIGLEEGDIVPLWTMSEDDSTWDFTGDWFVVEKIDVETATRLARIKGAEDDDLVGSDNTEYVVRVESLVPGESGAPPPPTAVYNHDDRSIFACVRGRVDAEGLHNDDEVTDPFADLETQPVGGVWVGFSGSGLAENCNECSCTTWEVIEVCEDVEGENGETTEQCHNETVESDFTTDPPFIGANSGDICETLNLGRPNEDNGRVCTCTDYRETVVMYQGSSVTNAAGEYCSTIGFPGGGGSLSSGKVIKDWIITEEDPNTGALSSYPVHYEHSERPRLEGELRRGNLCDGGTCATWNHTMPCEWFWQNNACAVVGGCEVHALRDFDEDEHSSYYEDDEQYPY